MVNIFLPLIFADGKPSSLEKLRIEQLQKFIPFLLSCCPNDNGSNGRPVWWPEKIPYEFPLRPFGDRVPWEEDLRKVVAKCYEYHKCEHVLRFCQRLSQVPLDHLVFKEGSQGFMSIFNSVNKKLIVTYKKKNQMYDRPSASPFKSLLPKSRRLSPPRHIEDIYLCNYCDEEFTSGREAIAHESVCSGKVDDKVLSSEALDQVSAMRYFGLGPSNEKISGTPPVKRGTSVKLTARSYLQIPISSPLGLRMKANVSPLDDDDKLSCIQRIELRCLRKGNEIQIKKKGMGGYALRCSKRKHNMIWTHTYSFNKAQRNERIITLRTGLNKKARLLQKRCKEVFVLVERLPLLDPLALHAAACLNFPLSLSGNVSSERVSEDPPLGPSTICIDLTCDDRSIDSEDCTYSSSSSDSFFQRSTSNHKTPGLVEDWASLFPLKPLVQV